MNLKYCKLCKNQIKLCESHIVSKFVFRNIKKFDKKIIYVNALFLNVKETQDGPKEYLFCKACESFRSKNKTYFSKLTQYDNFFNQERLTENEIYKIKCAVKHFEPLGIESKVHAELGRSIDYYAPIKEYATFKSNVEELANV